MQCLRDLSQTSVILENLTTQFEWKRKEPTRYSDSSSQVAGEQAEGMTSWLLKKAVFSLLFLRISPLQYFHVNLWYVHDSFS